ncbi:unnamed protein product [Porites evermanni]|uniref:Uncharacterized protein n=1 Tax=Porites evermanni TaxID=104178 RepID=A0ABN8SCY8_9CNID|nr:unnamed protein product [Porites evermanni]
MESPLKNIKEQVTCSICLDTFTDPKTITCLHTFCFECLKKHALISQRDGKFRCPECQAEVDLPEANRFDKLPTSFHHNSLLSVLTIRQSGKGNDISCGICKKKSAEISYCFECAKFMCSDCVNAHQLFSHFTEGHKVTPVKRFQAEDYDALMKRKSLCSQQNHEREVTRFFCHKCKLCVCQICITTDHKAHEGHDVELLDKVADCEKTNILMRTEILKEKTKVVSDAICKYEQTVSELETNIANAKREVSQTAEQMIAKIREHERHIITTLDNTRESRADKVMDSCVVHGDCVSRNVAIITTLLYAMLAMVSLLKNLKEHVTCSICLDTFTDPKTITCLHTFCFECIKKHALISQRNGKFRCPECQAEVDLPEANRFDKLPTSFHHNSLLSSFCSQQYHEREVTRFFCLKCQICVCQICIATDHKAHDVEPLEKAADDEKAKILTRTEVLKTKIKFFGDTIREYEQTVLELETNLTNAKREVSKAAEQMIAKIREDERRIITALENTRASRADKLDSAKAQVQSLLKQINQAIEFAENLIQRSSSSDVMQSKNYLEQRFNDLENTPIPELPVNSFLKFYQTKEEKNLTLGYIATSEPLNHPLDVTYLNDDNILLADQLNHRIQQFNVRTGNYVKSFGKKGTKDGEFQNPASVCVDEEGRVIVADFHNNRIQVLSQDGEPLIQIGNILEKNTNMVCQDNHPSLETEIVKNKSGDFQPQDYEALMRKQSFCSQQYHEREVTRFFCLKCQICVCQICIATDH